MSTGYLKDGWFNGDPKMMIKNGTYEKHRDAMKGLKYSDEEISSFDAQNAKVNSKKVEKQEGHEKPVAKKK